MADIAHYVERRRALNFVHPVAVEFLADADFNRKVTNVQKPTAKQQADTDNAVATLRALGLINGPVDLQQASNKLASQEILGLYSYKAKRVFVRGSQLTPDVRETLAHELTHALQDQVFDLSRYDDAPSGVSTAYRALFEADAMRVAASYVDTLPAADKQSVDSTRSQQVAQANQAKSDVPDVLGQILEFPYAFGPAFVAALDHQGGTDAINRAFKKPPVSEAQILDPQSYLSGTVPQKVAAPVLAPNQKKLDHADDFGQVSMVMVLGQRLDYGKVWPALQGWAGDQYVTYREGGRVCVAVDTALRNQAFADRFASTTSAWAATLPAATETRLGPTLVELRSCDPGNAGAAPKPPATAPFDVLAVRSQIIAGAEQAGVPLGVATCAADGIIAQAGPDAVGALASVQDDKDPRIVRLQAVGQRVATACARSAGLTR